MDKEWMKERGVKFTKRFSGKLIGWKLVFVEFPKFNLDGGYANIEQDPHSIVEGIIYEVDDSVSKLDKFEQVPVDYFKKDLIVKSKDKEFLCLVYVGNKKNIGKNRAPTQDYLNHLLKGKEFLSEKYYEKLERLNTFDD